MPVIQYDTSLSCNRIKRIYPRTYSKTLPPRNLAPGILGKPPCPPIYSVTLSINLHTPVTVRSPTWNRQKFISVVSPDVSKHLNRSHLYESPIPEVKSCSSPQQRSVLSPSVCDVGSSPLVTPVDTTAEKEIATQPNPPFCQTPDANNCSPSQKPSESSPLIYAEGSLRHEDSDHLVAPVALPDVKEIVHIDTPATDTSSLHPTDVFHFTSQLARPKPRKFKPRYAAKDAGLTSQPSSGSTSPQESSPMQSQPSPSSTSPQESSHAQSPSPALKESSQARQLTKAAPCTPRRTRSSAPACKSSADVAAADVAADAVKDASLTSYMDISTLPNIPMVESRVSSAGKNQFVRLSLSGKGKKKIAYRCYSNPVTRA